MNIWNEKINHWAKERANTLSFTDEVTSFTYSELKVASDELTSLFQKYDLKAQDRILVMLPRSAIAATVLAALLKNQIVGLFVDTKTSPHEFNKIITTVRPHAIISLREHGCVSSETLTIKTAPFIQPKLSILEQPNHEATPKALNWLLGTSGSTGKMKAVMLSAENLIQRTESEIEDFQLSPEMTLLNTLPFSHDLGLNQLLTTLYIGGTLLIKANTIARLSEYLAHTNIAGMTGTPLIWTDFLKLSKNMVFPHIQFITISGGQLDLDRRIQLTQIFPSARILKTYGQTETFRTFISEDPLSDDLGRVIKGVQVEVGEDGELIHFGQTRMLGYLFDKELSDIRKISSPAYGDGVLTQDLVRKVFDGKYIFYGRKDDVIKRFEQRFHLSEVEKALRSLPKVIEAVAVTTAAPEGDWRQSILGVYVTLEPHSNLSNEELLRLSQERLSYYKAPDFIRIVSQFPQTSSHKVDRQSLKADLAKENVARV